MKLNPATIKKAMWAAVSPNGKLLWTSSNNNLLAYNVADISPAHSWPTHAAIKPVRILKNAVPPSGVDGGAFYNGRLYLAGTIGNAHQVWSIDTANGTRRLEISRTIVGEQEGIDFVSQDRGKVHPVPLCSDPSCGAATLYTSNSFGGVLQLMVMPQPDGNTPPTYAAATLVSFDPLAAEPTRTASGRRRTGWSGLTENRHADVPAASLRKPPEVKSLRSSVLRCRAIESTDTVCQSDDDNRWPSPCTGGLDS